MFNDVRDVHIGEANQVNARRYHDSSSTIVQPGGHHTTHTEVKARTYIHNEISKTAMTTLSSNAVLEALHNSDERCDAPACFPKTRKAVQQDIMSWITNGDDDDDPKKIMWLHGPAGSGKTAIAGSIAETCEDLGILAGSFFFSSYAGSGERSSKRGVVATLVYSLVQHDGLNAVRESILAAIERDNSIFRKRLRDQCKTLLLKPFHDFRESLDSSPLPQVIILDGIDEIEGQGLRTLERHLAREASERDQIDVLSMLLQAARDPKFPFRILVVSRPERVIQDFFTTRANHITRELCLDEKYDADSDIALFLRVKLSEIRRRYRLPTSWANDSVVEQLVENASGQFVYADTVIRFLESADAGIQVRLDCVLGLDARRDVLKPFAKLDALYTHILQQSPDPILAAEWIRHIQYNPYDHSAFFLRHCLEEEVGQACRLLENLSSLLYTPPADDLEGQYELYHMSLIDFLLDSKRSVAFPESPQRISDYKEDVRFARIMLRKVPVTPLSDSQLRNFHRTCIEEIYGWVEYYFEIGNLPDWLVTVLIQSDAFWWMSTAIIVCPRVDGESVDAGKLARDLFSVCTSQKSTTRCTDLCTLWRGGIYDAFARRGASLPDARCLIRERMFFDAHLGTDEDEDEVLRIFDHPSSMFELNSHLQPSPTSPISDYTSVLSLADAMYARLPHGWEEEYHKEMEMGGVTGYNVFETLISQIEREVEAGSSPPTGPCYLPPTPSSVDTIHSLPVAYTDPLFDLPPRVTSEPPSEPALDTFIESIFSFD
ncbi:hypothetical protein NMY22_g8970 [Coprinellus aureogranulatus]|nr:hypothetical protein NMY22_g8970 [Coprinellus aureogranulatus]